jgi:SAM-dependent methyltransferase
MDPHLLANQRLWDVWAELHSTVKNPIYDLDAFRAGACSLDPIEVEEVGDVSGKSLLHLQCHFGMDTLSWARRGARATGVDFSERGIEAARQLAGDVGLDARFIQSDIFALPDVLEETFDIVFTSAGILCWLDDLEAWGRVVSRMLAQDGVFYIREFHPFPYVFDDSSEAAGELRLHYPYFNDGTALRFENDCSYAAERLPETCESFEWAYTFSDVINALIGAGLVLEFMHEFPFSTYQMLPFLVEESPGRWVHPTHPRSLPLQFSLRARHA